MYSMGFQSQDLVKNTFRQEAWLLNRKSIWISAAVAEQSGRGEDEGQKNVMFWDKEEMFYQLMQTNALKTSCCEIASPTQIWHVQTK